MKNLRRALCAILMLPPLAGNAADSDAILGIWTTGTGRSKVEILKEGDTYFGKVSWLQDPTYQLHGRPIMGMQIMEGFRHDGADMWMGGTIYDPESGTTYRCRLTLAAPNKLEVRGFVGISLLGRTTIWTR
jgi:uncharacterized protein (DUF2147 family)